MYHDCDAILYSISVMLFSTVLIQSVGKMAGFTFEPFASDLLGRSLHRNKPFFGCRPGQPILNDLGKNQYSASVS